MTSTNDPRDRLMEEERELTDSIFVGEDTRDSTEEDSEENSAKDAYRFFCHQFKEERDSPAESVSSMTDTDFIINIEDDRQSDILLGQNETGLVEVDPNRLFVPLDTAVEFEDTLSDGLKPRFVEDEGIYVSERLQIAKKMYDKMSHRLLQQSKGWCWFGENGCLKTLPNPLKNYWQAKIDFPFPSIFTGLTTEHIKPMMNEASAMADSKAKNTTCCWQLDLNLIGLHFSHHPLFSREHVLASRLLGLCESYKSQGNINKSTHLQEKLRALKKSKKDMDAQSHTFVTMFRSLNSQIRETQRTLRAIGEEDALLLRNIITTWQQLKNLRVRNGCVNTSVKLFFQRVELNVANNDGTSVHCVGEGTPTDSTPGSSRAEEEEGSIFVDDDIIFSQYCINEGLQNILDAHTLKKKAEDDHQSASHRRMSSFPISPVLTMNEVITSDFGCGRPERYRRVALRGRTISIKIFYNGKLVSTTSRSPLDSDFKVNIEETFNMQLRNWPESLMLEIREHKRFRSTLLAKVFLPIPHRNVTSASAPMETSELSCDQEVKSFHTGVGSNVFFKMNDDDREHVCMLTTAKLYYVLSWAVDDRGVPKSPPAAPISPRLSSSMAARMNRRQLEWLMRLRFDPNHPANSGLNDLLREVHQVQADPNGRCRLVRVEKFFATDEELEATQRLNFLRLRDLRAPKALLSVPTHLLDRDITQAETENDIEDQCELPRHQDSITAQRKWSIQYFQKLVSDAQKDLHVLNKEYKLHELVREHQDSDTPCEINWDVFRREQQLKPRRRKMKCVPPSSLSRGELTIRVNVESASHLPFRQHIYRDMENHEACCGLSSDKQAFIHWTHRNSLQDQLQPFAEVNFQSSTFQTNIVEGPDPIWREEFCLSFSSSDGDYSHAGLANVQDDIIINIFDAVIFQLTERNTLKGCGTQTFFGKQWLGSVNIPFRGLLQQSKIGCTLKVNMAPVLLGYTWSRSGSCHGNSDVMEHEEASYLTIFITLDPPISSKEDPSEILQKPFSPNENKETLALVQTFVKACRAADKQKRFVCTVVNSEGQLVLATSFFSPLPPPPEILQDDDDDVSESQRTFLHQKRVAAFVSLIPVLPSSSEIGDYGDMWLTSKKCLDLVIGNSVSLAVLLCNFFLHLGEQAWVLLGTSIIEGETAYVLTMKSDDIFVWNPKDGKCYRLHEDIFCPIVKVDCLVNQENVWFHKSNASAVPLEFKLSDHSTWIALKPAAKTKIEPAKVKCKSLAIQYHLPESELAAVLQRRLEERLKQCVMEWRYPHPTRWNRRCPAILSEILPKLEMQQDPSSIKEELRKLSILMKDHKVTGMPLHMAFTNMDAVIERVWNSQIHSTEIPGTEFALSVYIHAYPNDILSVWVFVASLVMHQQGTCYRPLSYNGQK